MLKISVELLGIIVENHDILSCSQIFPSIARLMRHSYILVVALYVDNYVEQLMQSISSDNIISEHEVPGEPFAFLIIVNCNCLKLDNRAKKEDPYDDSGKFKRGLAETCPPPVQFKVKYLFQVFFFARRV